MVNYSEKLLTKMLQGGVTQSNGVKINNIGTKLNSVRALAPYKGSKDAQDLLDLYVGNTHYRQINKALRAPDIDTARRQVWDEAGLMTNDSINYNLNEHQQAEDYFQQVLASTPHIENTLLQQPAHIPTQTKYNFANLPESIGNAYDDYINQNLAGNTEIQRTHQLALNEHIISLGETPEALGLRAPSRGVLKYGNWKPDEVFNFILEQNPTETRINTPISRGLHFDNEAAYDSFVNQHQPGAVIEYPAFTSTTTLPNIQEGFSDGRDNESPVIQTFQPKQGVNRLEARDVNNPQEGERLYAPGQRFKVIDSQHYENYNGGSDGRQMTLQETDELPQVQQRTQGILGRMKPRLANIDN